MRIVLVECDHDSFVPERELAAESGIDFEIRLSSGIDELVEHAQGADGILMQYAQLTGEVLDQIPGLKAVGRYGVGVDTVDIDAASARGIAVCNVPDYGSESVSDHAIALALSVARGVTRLDRSVRRGSADIEFAKPMHEISSGRVFGIIGAGLIGRAAARKARGLGFRTIGYDVMAVAGTTVDGVEMLGFDEVLRTADVVSLHVPLGPDTLHLIDGEALAGVKPGTILVNTSRGGVVDTDAVVDALTSGRLGGAGLDVFETEPLPLGHPLLDIDSAVLTPHVAWYTEESYARLKRRTLENVIEVCEGRTPRNILNPSVLGS